MARYVDAVAAVEHSSSRKASSVVVVVMAANCRTSSSSLSQQKKKKKVGKVLSALPRALEEWVSKEGRIERKFRIIDPLQIQHTHPVAFLKLPRKGEKRKKKKEKRSGEDPHSYVETG